MKSDSFFQKVYHLVCQIPPGKVATYGQIAVLLGHPGAARTVGWALHGLPEGSSVPWHRVINAKGRISTRSLRTPNLQQLLLAAENVRVREDGSIDLCIFQYEF